MLMYFTKKCAPWTMGQSIAGPHDIKFVIS